MRTAHDSGKAFQDREREQTAVPKGRYVRQRCFAAGCIYHAVLLTNPDTGDGLCEFHSAADDPNTWPKLSELLRRREFLVMQHELFVLDGIKHRDLAECLSQISRVQKAGLACGMKREELRLHENQVWKFGQKCIETEVPACFHYRVTMAFTRYVVNLAKPLERQAGPDYRERGMQHIDVALKFLSGELMPAHIRPATGGESA